LFVSFIKYFQFIRNKGISERCISNLTLLEEIESFPSLENIVKMDPIFNNLPPGVQKYMDNLMLKDSPMSVSLRIFYHMSKLEYEEAIKNLTQDIIKDKLLLANILKSVISLIPQDRFELLACLDIPIKKIIFSLIMKVFDKRYKQNQTLNITSIQVDEQENNFINVIKSKAQAYFLIYKDLSVKALAVVNYAHCNHHQCKNCKQNYLGFISTLSNIKPLFLIHNQTPLWHELMALIKNKFQRKKKLITEINTWDSQPQRTQQKPPIPQIPQILNLHKKL